jgi:hypothetical protein
MILVHNSKDTRLSEFCILPIEHIKHKCLRWPMSNNKCIIMPLLHNEYYNTQ